MNQVLEDMAVELVSKSNCPPAWAQLLMAERIKRLTAQYRVRSPRYKEAYVTSYRVYSFFTTSSRGSRPNLSSI